MVTCLPHISIDTIVPPNVNGINANQDDQDDQDDPIVPPDATMKKAKKKRKQKQPTDPYAIRYKTKKTQNCAKRVLYRQKKLLW